ncbi:MAG: trypsin-like peptidase domain-containing protein [Candidatus Shapirobacteria bacterium]|nr:trypsin-like peptidase domain-containing protein [Candidatus Shapirobacteria bacterium]
MRKFKRILTIIAVGIVIVFSLLGGAISDRLFGYKIIDRLFPHLSRNLTSMVTQKVLTEESVVIDAVDKVGPSVVTINIEEEQATSPFGIEFGPFGFSFPQNSPQTQKIQQNIGTGFIISQDGLIVTNKHVVSNTKATYKIITKDDQTYDIKNIYRDPGNDLAILKIDPLAGSGQVLKPVEMGDSDKLKVGQFVIAIGTALGEFKNTVTTGVVSGLGRGITAGSALEGSTERLDNVIQTDAAINPGNSGGPLLNSAGQVIGINVAVASGGQNISFAIPINIIKEAIDNFNKTGKFDRPFLGVRYRMISRDVALMNDVPQGAYVVEVVAASPADKADIKAGDILTKFDNQSLKDEKADLAKMISQKKVGDKVSLAIWRNGKEMNKEVTLQQATE